MLPFVDHVNNEEEGIFGFTLDRDQGSEWMRLSHCPFPQQDADTLPSVSSGQVSCPV